MGPKTAASCMPRDAKWLLPCLKSLLLMHNDLWRRHQELFAKKRTLLCVAAWYDRCYARWPAQKDLEEKGHSVEGQTIAHEPVSFSI
jgi:hypothetical protein